MSCILRWSARRAGPTRGHVAQVRLAATSPITRRAADFSRWYLDVIAAADLIDAGPVKGQVILKPRGYAIWEAIRGQLDARIRASGAVNAYFPLLVPASFFAREAAHIEGFAKECAVVTHHRLRVVPRAPGDALGGDRPPRLEPDPAAELGEPLVVRPTSETVIWDAFSRWISSHRDLPLVLNQWANVVRWEMRTRPFLRTSEFLWQEGHTAHATEPEARARAADMLALYKDVCEHVLAMPVVTGPKSASERFAGADDTLTCEAMMPNGWALQSATSHFLGRNFSRAFNVHFAAADGSRQLVWATSWGASTRLIGGAIMTHSDDVGLVLPPAVAPVQVVIVPIAPPAAPTGSSDALLQQQLQQGVLDAAEALRSALAAAGLRVAVDTDTQQPPGARFFAWERKGVPLRLEVGPRDVAAGVATLKDRIGGPRSMVPLPALPRAPRAALTHATAATHDEPAGGEPSRVLVGAVQAALASVHARLLDAARGRLRDNVHPVDSYEQLRAHAAEVAAQHGPMGDDEPLGGGAAVGAPAPGGPRHGGGGDKGGGRAVVPRGGAPARAPGAEEGGFRAPWRMFLAPWHDDAAAEAAIKAETSYTIRCFPAGEQGRAAAGAGARCFYSGRPATHVALFARAF